MKLRIPLMVLAASMALAPGARAADPDNVRLGFSRMATAPAGLTFVTSARDSTGRLFVAEQRGRILIYKSGLRSTPYLDIRDRVNDGGYEQGLLSIAFHPKFKENRYLFAAYTDYQGDLRISRFRASSYTSNTVSASTERILLQVEHRENDNHNGGQLFFGSKYLYITTGDGGGGGDPDGNAQDKSSLLGKILRINIDSQCGTKRYCSPSSNPFYGSDKPGRGEIWLYGLRNPWRAGFDRANYDMYIADVGQNAWEEVDRIAAGASGKNLGWDCREGKHATSYGGSYCTGASFTNPVWEYDHSNNRCSITGGYVYRGSKYRSIIGGLYIYADYCSGEVWALGRRSDGTWDNGLVYDASVNFTSFGEGQTGELYAVTAGGGLYRVTARNA